MRWVPAPPLELEEPVLDAELGVHPLEMTVSTMQVVVNKR